MQTLPDDNVLDQQIKTLLQQVGDRVRDVRTGRNISRRVLSERSGVSPRYLAQLEAGEGNISIGLLQRVSFALETPLGQFLSVERPFDSETMKFAALYADASDEKRHWITKLLEPKKIEVHKSSRICLIGLRGAGKSTLGSLVASEMGTTFYELNRRIEAAAGIPVGEIIALYGQEGFRQLEANTLQALVREEDRFILAVGGGIVGEAETFEHLTNHFHTIWIKADPEEHMERVRGQGDMRPMAGNPEAMAQLRSLLTSREAQYSQADAILDTAGKSVEQSAQELAALIRKHKYLK